MQRQEPTVPALRFPEFSDAWVKTKLNKAFTIFNGYAFSSNDAQKKGAKWVKIADIGINTMKTDTLSYLPIEFLNKYKKFILSEGDYVIALTRPILNGKLKIARIDSSFNESLLNQRVGKIKTKQCLDFIYFFAQRGRIINDIENEIAGTDPPNLSPNNLKYISSYICSHPEQQKIAAFLGAVDEKIAQLQKKKDLLEDYKKGCMQKLFSQELRFTDDNGNPFPDWEEMQLGDLVTLSAGTSKSKYITEDGERYIIDMGSVSTSGKLIPTKKTNYNDDLLKAGQLIMPKDDIGGGRIIGRVGLIDQDEKYVLGDHVYLLDKIKCNSLFLSYIINSFEVNKSFRRKANGTAQLGLARSSVLKQVVNIPKETREQDKIANFLSSIDDKIALVVEELDKAKIFKKGLLQQMFV